MKLRFLLALALIPTCLGCSSIRLSALLAEPAPAIVLARGLGPPTDGHDAKLKITLPLAIELCVTQNFRLLAGAEKVRQAEADLVTASLIPNPSLYADYQLIPLQATGIHEQLGPPQADALLTMPIDWLLFGKRAAARQAARLGISVAQWDFNDLQRVQIFKTVDAFYESLMTEEMLKEAEESHRELQKIQDSIKAAVKAGKQESLELDRITLAVQEAFLEIHARELAVTAAKAKLRPLIGRSASDPDFEVDGVLTVKAVVPPPTLAQAVALAEQHRPDLKSDQFDIDRHLAQVHLERRRAKPQVSVTPGWSYQNQSYIDGFRNGSMFDIGISTSLPITDRNQGNIRKAEAQVREARKTYLGNRADALAEVETTLGEYEDAVEDITQNNTPATLKAAHDLHNQVEAAFKAGKRSLIDYLSAHHAYRQRLERVVEFEATYWRRLNKLNTVVGIQAFDGDKGATMKVGNGK